MVEVVAPGRGVILMGLFSLAPPGGGRQAPGGDIGFDPEDLPGPAHLVGSGRERFDPCWLDACELDVSAIATRIGPYLETPSAQLVGQRSEVHAVTERAHVKEGAGVDRAPALSRRVPAHVGHDCVGVEIRVGWVAFARRLLGHAGGRVNCLDAHPLKRHPVLFLSAAARPTRDRDWSSVTDRRAAVTWADSMAVRSSGSVVSAQARLIDLGAEKVRSWPATRPAVEDVLERWSPARRWPAIRRARSASALVVAAVRDAASSHVSARRRVRVTPSSAARSYAAFRVGMSARSRRSLASLPVTTWSPVRGRGRT